MKNFNKMLRWIVLVAAIAVLTFYFKYNHRVYDRANLVGIQPAAPQPAASESPIPQLQLQEKDDSSIMGNDSVTRDRYKIFNHHKIPPSAK
jgi:hypothetical protein